MMKTLLTLIILTTLVSCSSHSMKPESYIQFIKNPDNGLRQVEDAGPVQFEVQYKPLEYVCLVQNNSLRITGQKLKQLETDFTGLTYFNFSILGKNGGDPLQSQTQDSSQYKQRVNYLAFNASKDFWLLLGDDTLKCVIYHFERNYGLASRNDVVLAFEPLNLKTDDKSEVLQFCFRDKIFNTGDHSFSFSGKSLVSIPTLKTN